MCPELPFLDILKTVLSPYVLYEASSYVVVYKPPWIHSVPLHYKKGTEAQTLLDWCAGMFPEVLEVCGKHPWEGGILHRLDYETQGLVLFAKTQSAMDALYAQQKRGLFTKEYEALSDPHGFWDPPGFPHRPSLHNAPFAIASGFRPFGPGRKAVRPIVPASLKGKPGRIKSIALDQEYLYKTEILESYAIEEFTCFHLRISRGFRHQIRCHLTWIGFPLLNDGLYGGISQDAVLPDGSEFPFLALRARGISFYDPLSEVLQRFTIPGFLERFCPNSPYPALKPSL